MTNSTIISYPMRPLSGGRLEGAFPKVAGTWAAEPKFNGWRAVLHLPTGTMWNRKGELLTIGSSFTEAIEVLRKAVSPDVEWLDVEALERRHNVGKGTLIVLDYMVKFRTYAERREMMERDLPILAPCTLPEGNTAYVTPSVKWEDSRKLWDELLTFSKTNLPLYEGIVAKETSSTYKFQTRNPSLESPDWVKHRYD